MYKIVRVIGNNFVCSHDEKGREIILRGLGIGFKKQPGDLVPPQKIEKIYALSDEEKSNKLMKLLAEVPAEYLEISAEIAEMASSAIHKRLSENIYITLTDHICFAVERLQNKVSYPNNLLWEIRNFYPEEFELGHRALDLIDQKLGYRLPEDEAGFIALHIVNAEIDGHMSDIMKITELIGYVVDIVQKTYGIELDEQSIDYGRFITHLKFLGQRIFKKKLTKEDDMAFQQMIRKRYESEYQCSLAVRDCIKQHFGILLPQEEMIFLTIHIHRLVADTTEEE